MPFSNINNKFSNDVNLILVRDVYRKSWLSISTIVAKGYFVHCNMPVDNIHHSLLELLYVLLHSSQDGSTCGLDICTNCEIRNLLLDEKPRKAFILPKCSVLFLSLKSGSERERE